MGPVTGSDTALVKMGVHVCHQLIMDIQRLFYFKDIYETHPPVIWT